MFFYTAKVLSALLLPSNVVTLLLIAGLMLLLVGRRPVLARGLLASGVGLLIVCGYSPLGNILVLPLEQRFTRPALPTDVSGIIMLGGFESPAISRERRQMTINEAGERLTETIVLARRRPAARVIFTGGEAKLCGRQDSAADSVAAFLQAAGIERERIVLEPKSRTTYENALFLARMLSPKPGQRYAVVTSAYHMPRAVGAFRRQGFDVVPWPADYRTRGPIDAWMIFGSSAAGFERIEFALKEWVGLLAYRLSDRSSAVWPGSAPTAPASPAAR